MTPQELHTRQQWTLAQKVDDTLGVIDQFISRMDGKVYLSFSGGKDSTVLLHLCEIIKKDIKCVFVNTGCESIDVIRFVDKMRQEGHNIETIRPKLTPRQVWAKYGFPLVSKDQAFKIDLVRKNPHSASAQKFMRDSNQFTISKGFRYLCDTERTKYNTSAHCCDKLKKEPCHRYEHETGLRPIVATMASESILRESTYLRIGQCNSFAEGKEKSYPLSIWMEEDIWQFIRENHIELAEIYNKGVTRTGCVGCGFGAQIKSDRRLETFYRLYPKYYNMVLNFENNGVTYREALREMLAVNGLWLPDENPQTKLFN
jgi:3'-phosphoadenosine 5'-phosphosulfate sulfotransferase (PAPS reductase)/FAD synthetase